MRNVYEYDELNALISEHLDACGASARQLAMATKIHPAYLSRALKARAKLSSEQLFNIGSYFKFTDGEQHYLRLLGQYHNCSHVRLRQTLRSELDQQRHEKLKLANRLSKNTNVIAVPEIEDFDRVRQYYSTPITARVHMLLTVKAFRENLSLICKVLVISKEQLEKELFKLQRLEIIAKKGLKLEVIKDSLHLDEDHPLCRQNHVNWRLEVIRHLMSADEDRSRKDELHLSAAFTASAKTKELVRQKFQDFVSWLKTAVDQDVHLQAEETMGTILFDLY